MSTIRGDPTPCLGCRRRAASGGSRERAASHRLHCRSRAPRAVPRGSCARRLNPLSCPNYTMGESQLGHTAPLLLPLVPSPPPLQAVLRPRCQVNHRPAPRLLGFFSPAQPSLSSPLLVQCRNAVCRSLSLTPFHAESLAEKQTNFGVPTSTLPPGPCSCTSLLPGGARHSVVTGRHSDGARESPLGDGLGVLTHGRGGDAGWH